MCVEAKNAVAMRLKAAAQLLATASEPFGIGPGLRQVYPPEPMPERLHDMAMKIGRRG